MDTAPTSGPAAAAQAATDGRAAVKVGDAPAVSTVATWEEKQLLTYLKTRCAGIANVKLRHLILADLRASWTPKLHDTAMRQAKERLIERDHEPIGSNESGWWYCLTGDEADVAAKFLEEKRDDLSRKIVALRTAALNRYGPQMKLPL
jgi:hypothetical protein